MIRISGGRFRGRMIDSPKRRDAIRPTTAMTRESLFSKFQGIVPGCRFMDLFAGSGLMGIEAISRGARFVLAVEQNREHLRLIRDNYTKLQIPLEMAKAVQKDVLALLAQPNQQEPFDLVFLDPPYGFSGLSELVEAIEVHQWVADKGTIVVEHGSRDILPGDFEQKIYGNTVLSIKSLE